MENNKILSALNYFSIFFAPFIVPIIIWVAVPDQEVKHHAKRALLSHIIPVVLGIFLFIYFIVGMSLANVTQSWIVISIGGAIIYGLISLALVIWNIIQGVKVLR